MESYMNLIKEAEYWRGYRKCFLHFMKEDAKITRYCKNAKERKVYEKAVCDFILQRWENMREIAVVGYRFVNHKRDEKGRLIYCEVEAIGK